MNNLHLTRRVAAVGLAPLGERTGRAGGTTNADAGACGSHAKRLAGLGGIPSRVMSFSSTPGAGNPVVLPPLSPATRGAARQVRFSVSRSEGMPKTMRKRFAPVGSSLSIFGTNTGKGLLPISCVPVVDQERIGAEWDPVEKLGLNDDSVFFRSMAPAYLKGAEITGNPNSCAQIANPYTAKPNYYHTMLHQYLNDPSLSAPERRHAKSVLATTSVPKYVVGCMGARDLPIATLNVMYGRNAMSGAHSYARPGYQVTKMTLGDLRKAGGGEVYYDVGCLLVSDHSVALIVTLPRDQAVTVEVLPVSPPDFSTRSGDSGRKF